MAVQHITRLTKIKSKLHNIAYNYIKQPLRYLLITSIILITVIKISLIGTGFLAFPDELRYILSGRALQYLSELKIEASMNAIFSTHGRPADAILKTIPNAIQYVTAHALKLNYYESKNSYPLFIYNFIIYCLILIVHFKFSKLLLHDDFMALVSVLLVGSLTNSYLYLRHALPYDSSLLILYLVVYKICVYTEDDALSFKKSFLIGICSFCGFLVYPGYFPLFIVGLFLLFFNKLSRINLLIKVYHSSYYIFGSIFCLIIFEAMSRFAGRSYILDTLYLSATVNQGTFEESFTFLMKYLFEVEGLNGTILIIGLTLFCFIMLYQIKNKTFKQLSLIMLLGIAIIGLILIYASQGFFLRKMVFYGRLLHQYLPFICLFSLFAVNKIVIRTMSKKELCLSIISLVFMFNFLVNFIHYTSFSYPRDIAWELSKTNNFRSIKNICEYDDSWSVMPLEEEYLYSDIRVKGNSSLHNIIVSNGCLFYPVNDINKYHIFNPSDRYKLMGEKSHFLNFKAYQYEGYNIVERHNIDKMNLQIRTWVLMM